MKKVFVWQRSDGWAWQTERDQNPRGHGLLLKEWAVEEAELFCGKDPTPFGITFTNPEGVPSRNA